MFDAIKVFFGFQDEDQSQKPTPKVTAAPHKESGSSKPVIRNFKGAIVKGNGGFPSSEIKIEEPTIYEDSLNIATYLREQKPVIVNIKKLDSTTGKRLIDFVCGTAYAINGHMMKIADQIFLFTPETVMISDSEERDGVRMDLGQGQSDLSQTPMGAYTQDEDTTQFMQNALG